MIKKVILILSVPIFIVSCKLEDRPGEGIVIPSIYDNTTYELPAPPFFPQEQIGIEEFPITYAGAELGRHLFYEKRLSLDNSLACGGCHQQEFAFTDAGNAVSENLSGPTLRNTPAVANLGYMTTIFWDGRVHTANEVVEDAIVGEQLINWQDALEKLRDDPLYQELFSKAYIDGAISKDHVVDAIGQFLRVLVTSNSKFDKWLIQQYTMTDAEFRGFDIFRSEKGDCFHCHFSSPLLTDNIFHNNGLDSVLNVIDFADIGLGAITGDLNDYGLFKTPTLRNLSFTAPYMHDGRFNTIEEVIDFYSEGLKSSPTIDPLMKNLGTKGNQLTDSEKEDLLAFLLLLDDVEFVTNPEFSDPF